MDADSDNNAGFQSLRALVETRSSRESSPVAKRQRRSFTPTSDDGDLVVPVMHNEDVETPTPENPPLIRQAVGFSWTPSISANSAPQVVPYFLPGQAPPPPKPKTSKPRAPRKKKDKQYTNQTGKFKIGDSNLSSSPGSGGLAPTSTGNSADTSLSSGSPSLLRSMIPSASYTNENATAGPGNTNGATTSMALIVPQAGVKRTRKSSNKKVPASNDSNSRPSARLSLGQRATIGTSVTPQYPINGDPGGPSLERPGQGSDLQITYSAPPCAVSGGTPVGSTNASTAVIQGTAQNVSRQMRMVTLLIEDMRSGVPDSQLAEVKVPLRVADDPDDGFWADAVEICNTLQNGPSRIDGPAKVYTMRGRFRQFFMRVDQFDQLQVQSAHLGVSKERTLSVFVESVSTVALMGLENASNVSHQPVPQGQLPRPPALSLDVRPVYNSGSEREDMSSSSSTSYQPRYSLVTRRDSNGTIIEKQLRQGREEKDVTGLRESSWHDRYTSSSQRVLTPPIPGRLADTQEEKDEAIANYIRSHIENHPGWIEYMQSKARPQRVSEVLKQYTFVEDRVRELIGRKTPAHWDGAPNSYVEKEHVWRVLKLDTKWGKECEETLVLVMFYGKNGSRYEDSRVVDMINDTSASQNKHNGQVLSFPPCCGRQFYSGYVQWGVYANGDT
ncbi:hypothetical protein J3R82DRAFT_10778 [Butyriboletus roseoflavus]|nr:hypothetical protein J3R82DRAFT_10778 [Butyriboletus roseoflavus]